MILSSSSSTHPPSSIQDAPSRPRPNISNGDECVKVMIRVRPPLPRELLSTSSTSSTVDIDEDGKTIHVHRSGGETHLSFDVVLGPHASQASVYEHAEASIQSSLQGFNATIFAYGQTGTGKTYTMLGPDLHELMSQHSASVNSTVKHILHLAHHSPPRHPSSPSKSSISEHGLGIIPRAINQIFSHVRNVDDVAFTFYASYIEIYSEKIYDLLQYEKSRSLKSGLEIRDDKEKGIHIPDLTEQVVTTEEQVYELMLRGARNRQVGQTSMNEHSSRSHTIFQLVIEQRPMNRLVPSTTDSQRKVVLRGKLNLVDLAGSEKWRTHSHMVEKRIMELTSINQSLSTLGNCIAALSQPSRIHIPYRDSKLTRLLQDSLGGNTKTTFIATISPSWDAIDETCSTLKFADRAKRIVVHTHINETVDDKVLIKRQQREIERLKQLLAAQGCTCFNNQSNQNPSDIVMSGGVNPVLTTSGNANIGTLTATIDDLDKENLQLKEDISQLMILLHSEKEENRRLMSISDDVDDDDVDDVDDKSQRKHSQNGHDESVELKLLREKNRGLELKLAEIEEERYDLTTRQVELDQYHHWLDTIPVHYNADGSIASISIQDRLSLMEQSVSKQATDLCRTKKLFVRDLQIVQKELSKKCRELDSAEAEIKKLVALKDTNGGGDRVKYSNMIPNDLLMVASSTQLSKPSSIIHRPSSIVQSTTKVHDAVTLFQGQVEQLLDLDDTSAEEKLDILFERVQYLCSTIKDAQDAVHAPPIPLPSLVSQLKALVIKTVDGLTTMTTHSDFDSVYQSFLRTLQDLGLQLQRLQKEGGKAGYGYSDGVGQSGSDIPSTSYDSKPALKPINSMSQSVATTGMTLETKISSSPCPAPHFASRLSPPDTYSPATLEVINREKFLMSQAKPAPIPIVLSTSTVPTTNEISSVKFSPASPPSTRLSSSNDTFASLSSSWISSPSNHVLEQQRQFATEHLSALLPKKSSSMSAIVDSKQSLPPPGILHSQSSSSSRSASEFSMKYSRYLSSSQAMQPSSTSIQALHVLPPPPPLPSTVNGKENFIV